MDMNSLPAKMVIGALGGSGAAICCHPLDVIRVNMQVQTTPRSSLGTALHVFKNFGVRHGLYCGLSAAFLRQWTYGAGRLGIYSYLLKREVSAAAVPFWKKLAFGMMSGGIGSFVGTPAEVALVRMSADAARPLEERRGAGVFRVLGAVIRQEGVAGMWNGTAPTIIRAMALSSVTLAVTSETKARMPSLAPALADQPTVNLALATINGSFFGTLASQPFDVVKSRLQNMVVPANGVPPYTGAIDCATKCFRESPLVLMRGFFPAFIKLTPYTMISLTLTEKITLLLTGKGAL